MSQLEFDFGATVRQANKLSEIANELEKISQKKMTSTMGSLAQGWKGDGATAFQAKATQLETKIQNTASNLERVSLKIKRVAKAAYIAEMKAKQLAETRK